MDLRALRAFVAVADAGSLAGAAGQTGIPRSTLRRRLRSLEKSLGQPLIARRGDGQQLTPAGLLLKTRGEELLRDYRYAILDARHGASAEGWLRLAHPGVLSAFVGGDLLPQLSRAAPGLRVEAFVCDEPTEHLGEDADAALSLTAQGALHHHPVGELALALFADPDYLSRRGDPKTIDDLGQHALLALGDANAWPGVDEAEIPIVPALRCSNHATLAYAVGAGLGIGLLPALLADTFIEPVFPVLPGLVGATRPIWLSLTPDAAQRLNASESPGLAETTHP